MIPDPLKDWFANKADQDALIALLNSEIWQKAAALLHRIALPKTDYTDRTSAEAITHAAMEQTRTAGFFSFVDNLWELTEPPKRPPQSPQGYSDTYVKAWAKARGMWEEEPAAEQQP